MDQIALMNSFLNRKSPEAASLLGIVVKYQRIPEEIINIVRASTAPRHCLSEVAFHQFYDRYIYIIFKPFYLGAH